jgi:hypothetical protein
LAVNRHYLVIFFPSDMIISIVLSLSSIHCSFCLIKFLFEFKWQIFHFCYCIFHFFLGFLFLHLYFHFVYTLFSWLSLRLCSVLEHP